MTNPLLSSLSVDQFCYFRLFVWSRADRGGQKNKSTARRISLGRGWEIISEDEGKGKEFMSPRSGRVFVQVENSSESDISPLLDTRVMKPGFGERRTEAV